MSRYDDLKVSIPHEFLYNALSKVNVLMERLSQDYYDILSISKSYADANKQGLDTKESCRALSDENITLSGIQTIDGVDLLIDDRVLVVGQTDSTENGIYLVKTGDWVRPSDADGEFITSGMYTYIEGGSQYAQGGWRLITADPIEIGVTELQFTKFSGASQIIPGTGLFKDGDLLGIDTATMQRISTLEDNMTFGQVHDGINGAKIDASNLNQSPSYRLATDDEKAYWGAKTDKAYVDTLVSGVSSDSVPKLAMTTLKVTATVDGQTQFEIPFDLFSYTTDSLIVFRNSALLEPSLYTIHPEVYDSNDVLLARAYITVTTGVTLPTEIVFIVLKNVPVGADGAINGRCLAVGTVPSNRIIDFKKELMLNSLIY